MKKCMYCGQENEDTALVCVKCGNTLLDIPMDQMPPLEETENVQVKDYVYDMPLVLNSADIVVTRSGAGAIAEVTYLGKAGIYIPYPLAADDHQRKNAEEVEKNGAGRMILDADLDGKVLLDEVSRLLHDEEYLDEMSRASYALGKRNSAELIAEQVKKLL